MPPSPSQGPDFRVLVKNARKNAQQYYLTYREVQPVSQVVKESALLMQEYTQSGGVRPFGVSCLVAGYDDDGPQLFQVDPSGAGFGWKATAIGKNYINAKNFLERRYNDEMELDDAIHIALLTLRESYEGEMTEHNIEVGVVGPDRVFRILTPQVTTPPPTPAPCCHAPHRVGSHTSSFVPTLVVSAGGQRLPRGGLMNTPAQHAVMLVTCASTGCLCVVPYVVITKE